jgi:acetolactate decarboxylase
MRRSTYACQTRPVLDERLVTTLHVQALRRREAHADRAPHVLFQASTIAALLDGAYDGDLTFAELARHGDLGLGTLNGLDGEMIAVDGSFYRADLDGRIHPIDAAARTPFAVVVPFRPDVDVELRGPLSHDEMLRLMDAGAPACAVRLDGRFDPVRARSVPRQTPPYRPLAEVAAEQRVFELEDVTGTIVGFRFPDYAEGVEVTGHHLHFVTHDRTRGGHVLECRPRAGRLRLDGSSDLHVELPPGVELGGGHVDPETLEQIEHGDGANPDAG